MSDTASAANSELAALVKALPEIYQPIYGHPEHSARVSRTCEDRLALIVKTYQALADKRRRPLRVLDLGCAQGFFSLNLAGLGAEVMGIDFQPPNIAVCQALAAEHPGFKITFKLGQIEKLITDMAADEFDLVLGLSVFHHIIHQSGIPFVQQLFTMLANKTTMGIFEIALNNEPPDWAKSQPNHPIELMTGFAFIHELAQHSTHLSAIPRPLYVSSNRCWCFDQEIEFFDSWKIESHAIANQAHGGTRRYFFGNGKIAKTYNLEIEHRTPANIREHHREVAFLQNPPKGMNPPKLFLHGRHQHEAWLVREQLSGELLLDLIAADKPYDGAQVLLDITQQLAVMEADNLCYDDLRAWNTLIGPDGRATLIDYGSISEQQNDCAIPKNRFLAFVIFMHEVLNRQILRPDPLQLPVLNPETLPEPYQKIIWDLYQQPASKWSFKFLHQRLTLASENNVMTENDNSKNTDHTGIALVLDALTEAYTSYQNHIRSAAEAAKKPQTSLCETADSKPKSNAKPVPTPGSTTTLNLSRLWGPTKTPKSK